jgi:FkbM family methyltransferase
MILMTIADYLRKHEVPCLGMLHIGAGNLEEAALYDDLGFKQVIWIEASPENADQRKQIADQHGHQLIKVGMDAAYSEAAQFKIVSCASCSSFLPLGTHSVYYPNFREERVIYIEAITGEILLRIHPECKSCNVLSVDVQGLEFRVLQGFAKSLEQFDAIFSEIFLEDLYIGCGKLNDVESLLWDAGFVHMDTWIRKGEGWGEGFWINRRLL